jgi:hypothetical protein
MFYVIAEPDAATPTEYRWFIYSYDNPGQPVKRADRPYSSRLEAIDAGWRIVVQLERDC